MGIDPLAIAGEQRRLLLNRLLLVEAGLARVEQRFAQDSPLEGSGFELVWGFSCQAVIFGFAESSLFGAGGPFFIPSPAIRFPERAEGVKGPKR